MDIMPIAIRHLKRHFVWPKEDENKFQYYGKALGVTVYFSSVGACCAGYIYDVHNRRVDIGYERDLAAFVSLFCQSFILLWLIFKQQNFSTLIKILSSFENFGKPSGFEKTEHELVIVTNVIYLGTIFGLTIYGFVPIFETSRCEEYNQLHDLREMIYIYFAYQMTAMYCGMPAVAVTPIVGYGFHEHMAERIRHLRKKLGLLNETKDTRRDSLREFIKHHQYVIRLMADVNGVTSAPLCIHVFFTSSVISLIIHQILNLTWRTPGGPIMHLLIWFIIISINSLGGQRVKDESTRIADEIYNQLNWYEMDLDIQKDLLIILCRAQRALIVSTGPFGGMDLRLLFVVVKALYTFCIVSLCRNVVK